MSRPTRREMIIGGALALGTLAVAPALSGCTMVASSGRRRIRPSYDAVVIGTGFGGAVAACRLAQAGFSVAVLERGRRYDHNPFPRNWNNPYDGWLWSSDQGLFDVKLCQEMSVVQAAGLGGGSLIYANVQMRAPAAVFDHGWPRGYNRAAIDPYYDLVAYMLDINPVPKSNLPTKSRVMEAAARSLGRSGQFCFADIAVDFGPPASEHLNKFGVTQRGCVSCGECCIGCNFHAKNTLDLNYLAIAGSRGANIATLCEVSKIERASTGYKVSFKDHASGGQETEINARYCFVCAGAVNSTELLLRCRDVHGTLDKLSPRLGDGYSGNGDFLAFTFNTTEPFNPSQGPTITTGVVYDRDDDGFKNWFIFEEGGYPKEIRALLQLLNPHFGLFRTMGIVTKDALVNAYRAVGGQAGATTQATDNTGIFLMMGRDLANGEIRLQPRTSELKIKWDVPSNMPLYEAQRRLTIDFSRAMGGNAAMNPLWRWFRIPVTVHSLGGCLMADTQEAGVTDANGEVYGYPGLFVLDGAILPSATGANPAHTIAAVAERNIEVAIRRFTGNPKWRAPEAALAKPIIDPVSLVTIPPGGTIPTEAQ
ncbi:MAG: GMC family oxidoreductase [Deltaproteobacteria bacterium]|nr:GMC family oxidoreductase [Deltaproteobacteria bacterium]